MENRPEIQNRHYRPFVVSGSTRFERRLKRRQIADTLAGHGLFSLPFTGFMGNGVFVKIAGHYEPGNRGVKVAVRSYGNDEESNQRAQTIYGQLLDIDRGEMTSLRDLN